MRLRIVSIWTPLMVWMVYRVRVDLCWCIPRILIVIAFTAWYIGIIIVLRSMITVSRHILISWDTTDLTVLLKSFKDMLSIS